MAGPTQQTAEDRKKIARGLLYLVPESPDGAAIDGMSDAAVGTIIDYNRGEIDRNRRPSRAAGLTSFRTSPPSADQPGAKDKAMDLIRRELSDRAGDRLTLDRDRQSLQALLGSAGYPVTLDNMIDDVERSFLPQLQRELQGSQSLASLFNRNARTEEKLIERGRRADVDATLASQEQAAITGKFTAGLVYAGYLKPQDIDDPKAAALAMNQFIVETAPFEKRAEEQEKIFSDLTRWTPSSYALDYLNRNTEGMMPRDPANPAKDRIEADLESSDPKRIALAQNFLALRGANIHPTGKIDTATADAARDAMTKPLAMPESLVKDGVVNIAQLETMASKGQLYLPIDALPPHEQEAAKLYPTLAERGDKLGISREQFIATRLIGQDPAGYERLLAEENERRASARLDAPVVTADQENEVFHGLRERLPAEVKADMPPHVAQLVRLNIAVNDAEVAVTRANNTLPSMSIDESGRPQSTDLSQIKLAAEKQRTAAETAYERRYYQMEQDGSIADVKKYIESHERREQAPAPAVAAPEPAKPGWLSRLFGFSADAAPASQAPAAPAPAMPAREQAPAPEPMPWMAAGP